jgi:PhzF family phenazine biosynthesis protein
MKAPLYQVDSFARRPFTGNPAAVCALESWIYDVTLQQIASENNLPATAFIVPHKGEYEIRWFSPAREIELCGHGTLAAGWVALTHLLPKRQVVRFSWRGGELRVERDGERLTLALPRREPKPPATTPPALATALGRAPDLVLTNGTTWLCVYDDAKAVADLAPDFATLRAHELSVIATAAGGGYDCDFVSRYFAPAHGHDEDAVTGSAHCLLVPYWADKLKRDTLFAKQISKRGGELWCRLAQKDVFLSGYVAPYFVGELEF